MAEISKAQMEFLAHHGIPVYKVFDASGMMTRRYQRLMSDLGMKVAIGVTPCREAGHTMRTRKGHCAQCKPHNLAFQARHDDPAYLYIATSKRLKAIKIGVAEDIGNRAETLNSFGYGATTDWIVEFINHVERAGRIEFAVHKELAKYQLEANYVKQGANVACRELFSCSLTTAKKAVAKVASRYGYAIK